MWFCDLDQNRLSSKIDILFPQWVRGDERVAILSPHDDDAILGAGYAALAALKHSGEVFVVIFSNGAAGYSRPEDKHDIAAIRRAETFTAYGLLGIPTRNILTFDYPDSSVLTRLGWKLNNGEEGSFRRMITFLRQSRITRVIIPNDYREHLDHTAVFMIGAYYAPLAGDPFCPDWATPYPCQSLLQYSVWADFSPEDALAQHKSTGLRANRAVLVPAEVETKIRAAIGAYQSQAEIIKELVAAREERSTGDGYVEIYRTYEPRPKLRFEPYIERIRTLKWKGKGRPTHAGAGPSLTDRPRQGDRHGPHEDTARTVG